MSNVKPKTARSYRGAMVDDNAIISINIKWLIQAVVVIAGLVYSYLQVENRIKLPEIGIFVRSEDELIRAKNIIINSGFKPFKISEKFSPQELGKLAVNA